MDKDLARHIIKTSYRSFGELTNLLPVLKAHCDPAEFEAFARAIAAVGFEMQTQIKQKIYTLYPDLQNEVDEKVNKYGVLI